MMQYHLVIDQIELSIVITMFQIIKQWMNIPGMVMGSFFPANGNHFFGVIY
jgi:hypothetical protein